jgi:hypothetical protein
VYGEPDYFEVFSFRIVAVGVLDKLVESKRVLARDPLAYYATCLIKPFKVR